MKIKWVVRSPRRKEELKKGRYRWSAEKGRILE